MKIGVLVKQVPDTEMKIKIAADGKGIETAGVKFIVNPYDEIAVEEALKTKEKADRGIHIDDTGMAADSFVTAKALAAALKNEAFDVIFCGKKAIDDDAAQVVQMAAEFLGIPHVMVIATFEMSPDGKGAKVERHVGGGAKEIIETPLPALFGCEKGLNTPRYASLPGIMKAKSKPLAVLKGSDLTGGFTRGEGARAGSVT